MSTPHQRHEHVYAIIRVDQFQGSETLPQDMITVTRIVHDQACAEQEVERLNHLNADLGCTYFWQITRLEQPLPAAQLAAIAHEHHAEPR
jgi:hypothetical protein